MPRGEDSRPLEDSGRRAGVNYKSVGRIWRPCCPNKGGGQRHGRRRPHPRTTSETEEPERRAWTHTLKLILHYTHSVQTLCPPVHDHLNLLLTLNASVGVITLKLLLPLTAFKTLIQINTLDSRAWIISSVQSVTDESRSQSALWITLSSRDIVSRRRRFSFHSALCEQRWNKR